MLDDRVIGSPSVHKCNSVQRDTDADEVENFVDEGANKCKKKPRSIQFVTELTSLPTMHLAYKKAGRERRTPKT